MQIPLALEIWNWPDPDLHLLGSRCQACQATAFPSQPRCPRCLSKHLAVTAVSGRAAVHTFTVNHQPWYPNLDPPYVVAIVVIDEQDDLRITTNIVGCDPDEVRIGMPVQVTFDRYDDVWIPMFEPVGDEPAAAA